MRTHAYAVFDVIEANNIYIVIIKHLKMLFYDAFEHAALFASRLAQENILMIFLQTEHNGVYRKRSEFHSAVYLSYNRLYSINTMFLIASRFLRILRNSFIPSSPLYISELNKYSV